MTPYRWIRRLGEGSFGEVWAAERAGEVLAVKVLVRAPSGSPAEEAIRREITLGQRLSDVPGVVAVRRAEPHDGLLHLEMDLVTGPDLDRVIERAAPMPTSVAIPWMVQVLRTLHAAGERLGDPVGFVHRDIKPANLLLDGSGSLRITDFGMARAGDALDFTTTRTGIVKGTPRFMAPEVLRGESPDNRADQFSVGAVLYELLTGRPLYSGDGLRAVLDQVARAQVGPALAQLGDSSQRQVLTRLLALDPKDRYPTCAAAADALSSTTLSGLPVALLLPGLLRLAVEPTSDLEEMTSPNLDRPLDTWEVTRELMPLDSPPPPRLRAKTKPTHWAWWVLLGAAVAVAVTAVGLAVILSLVG